MVRDRRADASAAPRGGEAAIEMRRQVVAMGLGGGNRPRQRCRGRRCAGDGIESTGAHLVRHEDPGRLLGFGIRVSRALGVEAKDNGKLHLAR